MMHNDVVGDELVRLLSERFIKPHQAALMKVVTDSEQEFAAAQGEQRPTPEPIRFVQAKFDGYSAVVEHEHGGAVGRVDIFYTNPLGTRTTIRSWLTSGLGFKINFIYAHAVIRHGQVIEWWMIHEHGRFRVTPLEPTDMARTLLYRWSKAFDIDPYNLWGNSLKFAGLTAAAALALTSGGTAAAAGAAIGRLGAAAGVASLGQVLGGSTLQNRTTYEQALSAHVALLMQFAITKQNEFDVLTAAARRSGQPVAQEALENHQLIPGYCVTARFTHTPGAFSLHYSGDDGVPFGNNQGTIDFSNYQLTSWWYLSAKRRIKIV